MANCYALEADDLHRRWLPREIFADIGIVDPEPAVAGEAAAVEEIAVQLIGIIGAGRGKGKPPPPAPATASIAIQAQHHLAAPVSDHSLLRRFRISLVSCCEVA
jgi:hypothetical protein